MLGGILFAGGLFIFGWTSNKDIHWIAFVILHRFVRFLYMLIMLQTMYWCNPDWLWIFNDISGLTQLHH